MDEGNRSFADQRELSAAQVGQSQVERAEWDSRFAGTRGLPPSNGQLQRGVAALIAAMKATLEGDGDTARYYIGSASASLCDGAHLVPAEEKSGAYRCGGGLAPWQIRRLKAHMDENLDATIHCDQLAQLVRLSVSHFMRVFKESFGCAPHTFLIRRRMERAQGLMLTTADPLGQIALACGLADQSHLTRLFQRWVGESPAAWRRARLTTAGGSVK